MSESLVRRSLRGRAGWLAPRPSLLRIERHSCHRDCRSGSVKEGPWRRTVSKNLRLVSGVHFRRRWERSADNPGPASLPSINALARVPKSGGVLERLKRRLDKLIDRLSSEVVDEVAMTEVANPRHASTNS